MTNDPDGWIRLPHLPLLVALHLFGILPIGTCAWKGQLVVILQSTLQLCARGYDESRPTAEIGT